MVRDKESVCADLHRREFLYNVFVAHLVAASLSILRLDLHDTSAGGFDDGRSFSDRRRAARTNIERVSFDVSFQTLVKRQHL